MVLNEVEKSRRFEDGLWDEIQGIVIANTDPSMRALAQIAARVHKKISTGFARRRREVVDFGGLSQGLSKKEGSSSGSAGNGWS